MGKNSQNVHREPKEEIGGVFLHKKGSPRENRIRTCSAAVEALSESSEGKAFLQSIIVNPGSRHYGNDFRRLKSILAPLANPPLPESEINQVTDFTLTYMATPSFMRQLRKQGELAEADQGKIALTRRALKVII